VQKFASLAAAAALAGALSACSANPAGNGLVPQSASRHAADQVGGGPILSVGGHGDQVGGGPVLGIGHVRKTKDQVGGGPVLGIGRIRNADQVGGGPVLSVPGNHDQVGGGPIL
jgi:hypothetical protein